jgi:hypothetical protein
MIKTACTYLHVGLHRGKEQLSTEKQSQGLMAECRVSNIPEPGHASPHLLDVNRGRLLLVVGSKVLSRMSITVERPALDGTVLKDA